MYPFVNFVVFNLCYAFSRVSVPASRGKNNNRLLKSAGGSDWLRCVCGMNVVFNEMPLQVLLFCICVEHKIKNYCVSVLIVSIVGI